MNNYSLAHSKNLKCLKSIFLSCHLRKKKTRRKEGQCLEKEKKNFKNIRVGTSKYKTKKKWEK